MEIYFSATVGLFPRKAEYMKQQKESKRHSHQSEKGRIVNFRKGLIHKATRQEIDGCHGQKMPYCSGMVKRELSLKARLSVYL